MVGHVGARLSAFAIIERSNFSGNSAMNGGSAVNLVSNARYDQATESAWISDWYIIMQTCSRDYKYSWSVCSCMGVEPCLHAPLDLC